MTDDLRAVLKAAGVECAEVDLMGGGWINDEGEAVYYADLVDDAFLALALLVAKYKTETETRFAMEKDGMWLPVQCTCSKSPETWCAMHGAWNDRDSRLKTRWEYREDPDA